MTISRPEDPPIAVPTAGAAPGPNAPSELLDSGEGMSVRARTQWQLIARRFFRHRLAMGSLAVLIGVVLLSYVGLWMWDLPHDRSGTVVNRGRPTLDLIPWLDGDGLALGKHPFGQDDIGRDYFAVTLKGAQGSIAIALLAGVIATTIGTVVGAISGFYRGMVDSVLMRFVDVLFTIPLLVVVAVLGRRMDTGGSIFVGAFIIAALAWLTTARVIRAEFMSLREKEFVEAARALGASNRRIIWKHILPNVIGSVIVSATLLISAAILVEAALSFIGFGVSDFSLGVLVQTYRAAFNVRPWLFWWPGIFIIVVALTINFIGDGLRDAFDPKQTRVRQ